MLARWWILKNSNNPWPGSASIRSNVPADPPFGPWRETDYCKRMVKFPWNANQLCSNWLCVVIPLQSLSYRWTWVDMLLFLTIIWQLLRTRSNLLQWYCKLRQSKLRMQEEEGQCYSVQERAHWSRAPSSPFTSQSRNRIFGANFMMKD